MQISRLPCAGLALCKYCMYLEKALEDVGERKVGPELLLVEVVAGLPQALSPEPYVPPSGGLRVKG